MSKTNNSCLENGFSLATAILHLPYRTIRYRPMLYRGQAVARYATFWLQVPSTSRRGGEVAGCHFYQFDKHAKAARRLVTTPWRLARPCPFTGLSPEITAKGAQMASCRGSRAPFKLAIASASPVLRAPVSSRPLRRGVETRHVDRPLLSLICLCPRLGISLGLYSLWPGLGWRQQPI